MESTPKEELKGLTDNIERTKRKMGKIEFLKLNDYLRRHEERAAL